MLTEEENKEGDRYHTRYEYDGNGNEAFREVTRPDGTLVLRVRRSFAGDGLQEVTEVEADSQGIGVDRHYRYLFEYTFHGEG